MDVAVFMPSSGWREDIESSPEYQLRREQVRKAQAELDALQAPRRVTLMDIIRDLLPRTGKSRRRTTAPAI
jgi:hypothetical protein